MKWFPHRRWLQIRLSTFIAVTLVAGALLGLNLVPDSRRQVALIESIDLRSAIEGNDIAMRGTEYRTYGWPATFHTNMPDDLGPSHYSSCVTLKLNEIQKKEFLRLGYFNAAVDYEIMRHDAPSLAPLATFTIPAGEFRIAGLLINAGVALAILLTTAFICEFIARKTKPAAPTKPSRLNTSPQSSAA